MTTSADAKKSPEEWARYVNALSDVPLVEAAEAANSVAFVRTLTEQGYGADDVHGILVAFAQRFRSLGQVPPAGGYVDLSWLADNPR